MFTIRNFFTLLWSFFGHKVDDFKITHPFVSNLLHYLWIWLTVFDIVFLLVYLLAGNAESRVDRTFLTLALLISPFSTLRLLHIVTCRIVKWTKNLWMEWQYYYATGGKRKNSPPEPKIDFRRDPLFKQIIEESDNDDFWERERSRLRGGETKR